ncbi:Cell division protein FtsQ [Rubripirellula amarantea]|uniref:Cell division protein FtsQ n=1 Tax=Rubripirellula amarantea TaxID=2527999 RepID=A0A5C5WVL0_9BACT|nr:hypothetical protein [Rubripirellula amarantea]TWT54299.1 Cell division protein FtsQ [Rubripirellula amarantea]
MRSEEPESNRPIRDVLRQLIKAPAALAIIWPAVLILGGYLAWHKWGSQHVAQQYFGVELSAIQVTPPPSYVRSDVAKSVYQDTAMDGLSLLDRTASAKIASAFSMHPWVRNVSSVRKLAGGTIDVRLEYREPVAMTRVFKPQYADHEKYYLPVDGDGVLLPSEEFSRSETRDFIHINVPGADSNQRPGSRFGDSRVEAAAKLAEVLAPFREQVGIKSIDVGGDPRLSEVPQLELTTHDGRRIWWGSPPGFEPPGERTTEMKLHTLLSPERDTVSDLRMASRAKPE